MMGHIGLTPQSATMLGGFKAQGRTAAKAVQLYEDALALQEAGCFAIVLEAVPDAGRGARSRDALDDPDDRHRRGRRLRRPGARVARPARPLRRARAALRQAVRGARADHPVGRRRLRRARCAAARSRRSSTPTRSPTRSSRSSRTRSRRFARGLTRSGARDRAPNGQHRRARRPPACASRLHDASPPSGSEMSSRSAITVLV